MNPEHPAGEPKPEPLARVVDMETYLFDHCDTVAISEEHFNAILECYWQWREENTKRTARAALWSERIQCVRRPTRKEDREYDELDGSRPYT